jgi:acyl-CoA thioester hydrolase
MFKHEYGFRVRYAETDRMDFVYYGNYATYFEVGRVEALRSLGVSYKQMEAEGILLPVLDYSVKFIRPARYDDFLLLETCIPEFPGARIRFTYKLRNESGELLTTAETTLVFMQQDTSRPCKPPADLLLRLESFFS